MCTGKFQCIKRSAHLCGCLIRYEVAFRGLHLRFCYVFVSVHVLLRRRKVEKTCDSESNFCARLTNPCDNTVVVETERIPQKGGSFISLFENPLDDGRRSEARNRNHAACRKHLRRRGIARSPPAYFPRLSGTSRLRSTEDKAKNDRSRLFCNIASAQRS